jgi:c-di-AMP phosphodiesterase-like protein
MIEQADRVVVMGHRSPDMDSLGSALGINRIALAQGKESAIVMGSVGKAVEALYRKAEASGQHHFISREEAKRVVGKDTLLVVVDTHRAKITECPDLLDQTDKIVLIDHHRKSADSIDNATLVYMETYASSTSELVTEILQYIGDGKKIIEKLEAEALLAGITVDTRNFSIKTGVRTFEAATWLKRHGADTASVRQYFQTDMDDFRIRAEIIARAEILPSGFALSISPVSHPDIQVLIAQAADELLNISGVRASFVAGMNDKELTFVSARSLGEINVQTIMERIGGGGHLTTAGAQSEKSPKEIMMELKEQILFLIED